MFPVKGLFLSFRMDFILGLFFLFNYIYISYWFYFYGETRLIYHINFFFFLPSNLSGQMLGSHGSHLAFAPRQEDEWCWPGSCVGPWVRLPAWLFRSSALLHHVVKASVNGWSARVRKPRPFPGSLQKAASGKTLHKLNKSFVSLDSAWIFMSQLVQKCILHCWVYTTIT